MISFTSGNLLDSQAQALVNTVNTVGVMGKGIALMFKERFPQNFQLYARACSNKDVQTGKMFVTLSGELSGPKWIVNFPTKRHWRGDSRIEWIQEGLADLRDWIEVNEVKSIALPPLGAGNGGLEWHQVKPLIEKCLSDIDAEVIVYEPIKQYQNIQKRTGVEKLTPARALISELVRRYSILGMDCSLLEIQKLTWFLERAISRHQLQSPLKLNYRAHLYGPYAENLKHMLDSLDGSYIHCEKRIADAGPLEPVWFNDSKETLVTAFLQSEVKDLQPALKEATDLIDGFQSPFGMELLATCDWLLFHGKAEASVDSLRNGLYEWPSESWAATRKIRIFGDDVLKVALQRLVDAGWSQDRQQLISPP